MKLIATVKKIKGKEKLVDYKVGMIYDK